MVVGRRWRDAVGRSGGSARPAGERGRAEGWGRGGGSGVRLGGERRVGVVLTTLQQLTASASGQAVGSVSLRWVGVGVVAPGRRWRDAVGRSRGSAREAEERGAVWVI